MTRLPVLLDGFRPEGVQAIAVCLLHAYANPAYEPAVVASHQITRELRRKPG